MTIAGPDVSIYRGGLKCRAFPSQIKPGHL